MTLRRLGAGLGLILATAPAYADGQTRPAFRDSDGIVISILYPGDYFTLNGELVTLDTLFTVSDLTIETRSGTGTGGFDVTENVDTAGGAVFSGADLASALSDGLTLQFGGATYAVETSGSKVWLRDVVTGERFAAVRHQAPLGPDAIGLTVNPVAYALD